MTKPFFTLIVPVYNVEKYLEQCLNSIVNQTFQDFELILINDGSTDHSLAICENYFNNNAKIRLISQDNRGLSSARNRGFAEAVGQYVWFVDSDDFLDEQSLEILYNYFEVNYVDVVGFSNYHFIDANQELKENTINPATDVLSKSAFIESTLLFEIAPWIYVFNINFLRQHHISFRADIKIHEDEFFLLEVLLKLRSIQFIDEKLYIYRIRDNSLMRSDNLADKLDAFVKLIAFLESLVEQERNKKFWGDRLYAKIQIYYKTYDRINELEFNKIDHDDFKKIRKIKLKINNEDLVGVKIMKLLHNYCFVLYKLKLLKG